MKHSLVFRNYVNNLKYYTNSIHLMMTSLNLMMKMKMALKSH